MKVLRIDHMHAWTDDVNRVAKSFRDTTGVTCGVYNFDQWGVKTVVVRSGKDQPFIEFIQPADPSQKMWQDMGRPGTPSVFGINLKVTDIDEAIAELTSKGIRLIRESKMNTVRQAWFDTEKTFGVQIELSEYPGYDLFKEAKIPPPEQLNGKVFEQSKESI